MNTDPRASETETDHSASYEFVIDLSTDNTHANVIRLVGDARRVLELGPATGYMTKILQANGCSVVGIEIDPDMARQAARFCERVIVGDLDELDLGSELGADRFDVIVAADVLEHLKDPLGALRRLRPLLSPEGFFVVSLPNVAHASVRLALLQGRFEYRDLGLLDSTHLRFFTHDSVVEMFDEAELAIVELHRQEAPFAISDTCVDIDAVPDGLIRTLEADQEAQTYQFVIKALPLEMSGLRELQRRLRLLAEAKDVTERELAGTLHRLHEFEEALASATDHAADRDAQLASLADHNAQLTTSLIEAHDQVLRRDEEIERLQEVLHPLQKDLQTSERELERARVQAEELKAHSKEQSDQLALRDEQVRRLRVRLARILSSPPAKIWSTVGRLPLLRSIVARRAAGYESAVKQLGQSGE
jgi:O-antigen biosynthesis protein